MRSWCSAIVLVVVGAVRRAGTDAVSRQNGASPPLSGGSPRIHGVTTATTIWRLAWRSALGTRRTLVFYERAEEAVRRSLELDPGNLEGKKNACLGAVG